MSYADRDGFIWMDGEFKPWREATVHVLTHTLHYGVGAFEGIRAYATSKGPAIFRLDEHVTRFLNSAKLLQMQHDFKHETLANAMIECVRKNELKSAYIRPIFFYGSEAMGLHAEKLQTHAMVAAWEWGAYLGADSLEKGIRVKTASIARNSLRSTLQHAKANGGYINSMMATQEAKLAGYQEAILLDHQGFVAEGSGENIFIVQDGALHTPTTVAILPGITRASIIEVARNMGLEVIERNITRDDVYLADEAFFTGTAAEITPIAEYDDRVIGKGNRGPITKQIQDAYFSIVQGEDANYERWLTIV